MKTVVITHQKGGVGKTTLTAWLGATWAAQGLRVHLLDHDPQATLLRHPPTGVQVSTATKSLNSDIDLLLCDTPPYLRDELSWLLLSADLILIPLKASPLDIEAAASTLELIEREDVKVPVRFILNMVRPGRIADETLQALEVYNHPVCATLVPERVAYVRGMLDGHLADRGAAQIIEQLVEELNTILYGGEKK